MPEQIPIGSFFSTRTVHIAVFAGFRICRKSLSNGNWNWVGSSKVVLKGSLGTWTGNPSPISEARPMVTVLLFVFLGEAGVIRATTPTIKLFDILREH